MTTIYIFILILIAQTTVCTVPMTDDDLDESYLNKEVDSVSVGTPVTRLPDLFTQTFRSAFLVGAARDFRDHGMDPPSYDGLTHVFTQQYDRRTTFPTTGFKYVKECVAAVRTDWWMSQDCDLPHYCGEITRRTVSNNILGTEYYVCHGDLRCDDDSSLLKYCHPSYPVVYYTAPTQVFNLELKRDTKIFTKPFHRVFVNYTIPHALRDGVKYFFPIFCDHVYSQPPNINTTHFCYYEPTRERYEDYCLSHPMYEEAHLIFALKWPDSHRLSDRHTNGENIRPFKDHTCTKNQMAICETQSFLVYDHYYYCPVEKCVFTSVISPGALYEERCVELAFVRQNFYVTIIRIIHGYILKVIFGLFNILQGTFVGIIDVYLTDIKMIVDFLVAKLYNTFLFEISLAIMILYYIFRDFYLTTYVSLALFLFTYLLYTHVITKIFN